MAEDTKILHFFMMNSHLYLWLFLFAALLVGFVFLAVYLGEDIKPE